MTIPDKADLAPDSVMPQVPTAANWSFVRLHLKIGWFMLLAFLTLGIVLEAMHGFKIDFYLNVERSTTRILWTLAHSVGAILGLVQIAFAASVFIMAGWKEATVSLTSACLNCASILLPAALFLTGAMASERGLALALLLSVPGLFFCFLALLLAACAMDRNRS